MNIRFYVRNIPTCIKLTCAFFCSFFTSKKKLWLISERGTEARDNGYWLFKYVKENHPEIKAKFIIDRTSSDRNKLFQYEKDLIDRNSFEHYIVLANASHLISTHIQGYTPDMEFFNKINKKIHLWRNKKVVFLQHGITKDNIIGLHYPKTDLDLFVCGAKCEFDYINDVYEYPQELNIVQYTGFCRFDNLKDLSNKRQILLMPTWRFWLNKEVFVESEYFIKYSSFLKSQELRTFLNVNDLILVFYPHYEIQKNINLFQELHLSNRIIIADKDNFDVQNLLKESSLLITDYSSVYWDFAYMKKPIIFYQFDEKKYREYQYKEGYFDYHNTFGYYCSEESDLFKQMTLVLNNNFQMEERHLSVLNNCFSYMDQNNCYRVFEAIDNL
jgi:CDP-glycerol glycerophosphotransferase (TagB/SpsB family)